MEKELKLFKLVDDEILVFTEDGNPILSENGYFFITEKTGVVTMPFPNEQNQIIVGDFEYNADRMGGAPRITATIMHNSCLDDLWTNNVFVEFNGEKYFILNTPSSSKSNTDARYQHELEFLSEREILNHVYFIDAVQGDETVDVYKSNSTNVFFYGDIQEFASRLSSSLAYSGIDGYTVHIDEGVTSEAKEVSFENLYVLSALQEAFTIYDIPYYFKGKEIHFGYTDNVIPTVFRYGASDALLSISKENANYEVVRRCTGTGSTENIPYYYPNETPEGDLGVEIGQGNTGITDASQITIYDKTKLYNNASVGDVFTYSEESTETEVEVTPVTVNNMQYIDNHFVFAYKPYYSNFERSISYKVKSEISGTLQFTFYLYSDNGTYSDMSDSITSVEINPSVGFNRDGNNIYMDISENVETEITVNFNLYKSLYAETQNVYLRFYNVIGYEKFLLKDEKKYSLSELGMSATVEPAIGDTFTVIKERYITPCSTLMPSIYRETLGAQRFYNAENDKYEMPDGGYYQFTNLYSKKTPNEKTVEFSDIKPTITEITNEDGQRIDEIIDVAFDRNDNDKLNSENEYEHQYFFVKLRRFNGENGFNLFDQAIEGSNMQLSLTTGNCAGCTFEIGVGKESSKNTVQVDENGDLIYDEETGDVICGRNDEQGAQVPQDRQNDTRYYEVWIAVKKDNTTYGQVMPNAQQNIRPKVGDRFVLVNINLPKVYFTAAEKRLEQSIIKCMYENNVEKFNFNIGFSRIYFQENPDMLQTLNENSRIIVEYNGHQYVQYIESFTYKMQSDSPIPEIEVNLVETLSTGQNSLQNAIDSVKGDIISYIGGGDFLKQAINYFIRKDVADWSRGKKTFYDLIYGLAGAYFGEYISGKSGGKIDKSGAAEFADIIARGAVTIGRYVEKTQGAKISEDGIADLLSAYVRGKIESSNFLSGALGTGFTMKIKEDGRSYIEVDELFVRMKAFFTALEIKKLTYAGGNFVFSPAGIILSSVEETTDGYKCYFTNDDGSETTENLFRVDDLCLCQTFNIGEGIYQNVSNKRYWRACTEVGTNYFVLSKTDCEANSDIPEEGDSVVVLGNKTDADRQNAILISVFGDGSPSITQHTGIKTYSLVGTEKIRISPTLNTFTGEFRFESGKSIEEVTSGLQDDINQANSNINEQAGFITAMQDEIDAIKNQADGAIESWFYDPVPTLDNEPAVNWTDDETKKTHLGDLYYDADGKSYRFQLIDGVYGWKQLSDSDVTKALEMAQKAQDTADGKRRVFVVQPTSASVYDVGDLWVNATYSTIYNNDLLRCKTAKIGGTPFDISHWELASKYTDDTKANQAQQAAEDAQTAADNAQTDATEAKQRLDEWADDGKISPTEKLAIKDEIQRIDSDKSQIESGYVKYALGTPTDYNTAYTNYRAQLVTLSSETPETISIPSDFSTKQTAYYTERSEALSAIASKAKDLSDSVNSDLQGYKKTVSASFTATAEEIEANVKSITNINGNIKSLTARVSITEEGIKQTVTKTEFNQSKTEILNTAASDATNKANQAKNDAISTASEDASEKADAAKNAAISDAKKNYATITTVTQMQTSIDDLGDQLTLKASKSDLTTVKNDLTGDIVDLTDRVSKAEIDLQPDNIWAGISTDVESVVDAIDIGGRNYALGTSESYTFTPNGSLNQVIELYTLKSELGGNTCCFSAKVRVSGCSFGSGHRLLFQASSNWSYKPNYAVISGDGQNKEYLVSWTQDISSQTSDGNIAIRVDYITGGRIIISEFKAEIGNKKTDWTPAPEDMALKDELVKTGINISNRTIVAQADTFKFQNNAGKEIAVFQNDRLVTSLIDVDELFSQNITVSNDATITNLHAININAVGGTIDSITATNLTVENSTIDTITARNLTVESGKVGGFNLIDNKISWGDGYINNNQVGIIIGDGAAPSSISNREALIYAKMYPAKSKSKYQYGIYAIGKNLLGIGSTCIYASSKANEADAKHPNNGDIYAAFFDGNIWAGGYYSTSGTGNLRSGMNGGVKVSGSRTTFMFVNGLFVGFSYAGGYDPAADTGNSLIES